MIKDFLRLYTCALGTGFKLVIYKQGSSNFFFFPTTPSIQVLKFHLTSQMRTLRCGLTTVQYSGRRSRHQGVRPEAIDMPTTWAHNYCRPIGCRYFVFTGHHERKLVCFWAWATKTNWKKMEIFVFSTKNKCLQN